jgi:hypothetical protein
MLPKSIKSSIPSKFNAYPAPGGDTITVKVVVSLSPAESVAVKVIVTLSCWFVFGVIAKVRT